MFGPRAPRYPLLKAYLDVRPVERPAVRYGSPKAGAAVAAFFTFCLGISSIGTSILTTLLFAAATITLMAFALRPEKVVPPTPERILTRQADAVAAVLKGHTQANRLHRALHPAVGATLEECAGYWNRIVHALGSSHWDTPQWAALREEALMAARLAMDEAIVHAGTTLVLVPAARPIEHVSDALEDIGLGPLMRDNRSLEPMPASFRPVRELAERLRELAGRSETAIAQRREESPEPASAAFRRLDAALGEMRHLEQAEGELRQGA